MRRHACPCMLSSTSVTTETDSPIWQAKDPFAEKETYRDSWFDMAFIKYFAAKMSQNLGGSLMLWCLPASVPRSVQSAL